jgi:hypothetical protein
VLTNFRNRARRGHLEIKQNAQMRVSTATALALIERWMSKMLQGQLEPYDWGSKIWSMAFGKASESPDTMWPLWLIWGALTDWVELRPTEKSAAEQEMLRAAREWLALSQGDHAARDSYLDRWVYDEMGYERKS